MGIISKSELLKFGTTSFISALTENNVYKTLLESRSDTYRLTRIFLSHKHGETLEINAARKLLESKYSQLYIDWEDEDMPSITSGETASQIKLKIGKSDRVVFLATELAIKSPWCNWELGYSDAVKSYSKNLALLPVKEDYGDYKGNEYLQIYPYIQKNDNHDSLYEIWYPDGSREWLDDWLKK